MHSHEKQNIRTIKVFIIQYLSGDFGYILLYFIKNLLSKYFSHAVKFGRFFLSFVVSEGTLYRLTEGLRNNTSPYTSGKFSG